MAGPNDPPAPGGPAPDPPKIEPNAPPPVGIATPGAAQLQPGHTTRDFQVSGSGTPGAGGTTVGNQTYTRGMFAAGPVTGSVQIANGGSGTSVGGQQTVQVQQGDTTQVSVFGTQQYNRTPDGKHQFQAGVGVEGDFGGNNPNRPRVQLGAYGNVGNVPGQGGVAVNASGVALFNLGAYDYHANPNHQVGVEARYSGVIQRDGAGNTVGDHTVTGAVSINEIRTLGNGSTVVRAGVSGFAGADLSTLPGASGHAVPVVGATVGVGVSWGGSATKAKDEGRVYTYEFNGVSAPKHGPFDVDGKVTAYDAQSDRVTIGEGRSAQTFRVSELLKNSDANPGDIREAMEKGKNLSIAVMSDGYNHISVQPDRDRAQPAPRAQDGPGR